MTSIESILFKRQRRCTGHVSSMQDRRMAKALIYGELRSGKRKRGALRKRYKDQFHKQLKVSGIRESIDSKWKQLSLVRDCWKETIKHAAASFEESRKVAVEEKRQCRKERSQTQLSTAEGFPFPSCQRVCKAGKGLHSHLKRCGPG